jgi:hypothetical protein
MAMEEAKETLELAHHYFCLIFLTKTSYVAKPKIKGWGRIQELSDDVIGRAWVSLVEEMT